MRCRTDDGPTEEDIKKIVRICMHKVGENETENNYSDEDSNDSEEKRDDVTTTRSNSRQPNGFNYQSSYQNDPYSNQMLGNNNWDSRNNFGGIQRAYNGEFSNQKAGYGNTFNSKSNSNSFSNSSSNSGSGMHAKTYQTEQDRACLVHCFFHELKMVQIIYFS